MTDLNIEDYMELIKGDKPEDKKPKVVYTDVDGLVAMYQELQAREAGLELQVSELREECAMIAESEPWPEGPVPLVVLAASKDLSYEQIVEATVKATRESIARKIRGAVKRNQEGAK